MSTFRPRYISFDCYGTLTNFRMSEMARELFADRIRPQQMEQFTRDFAAYRVDEVLGSWQPYSEVIRKSVQRTCRRWTIAYCDEDSVCIYQTVPTWGPHPDVPEPLARVAKEYPLVILSNAANEQIHHNVAKLGAPFHAIYTAEQAQAYKPRLRAFEYMIEQLGCAPEQLLHVSSSIRYDHMSANDVGIRNKVFVARGHEPPNPYYNHVEIKDIGGLPAVVGLE